ncbi:DUF6879 family protein [Actinocorallia aurantiaca]|uniref:DUF6879 domain-containing protein n=1 Tax=Actinocorallia aurantiaca TaxID=46204 RepID=A0ABN3UV61_9ACTN
MSSRQRGSGRPSRELSTRLPRFNDPIALVGVVFSIGLGIALDVSGAADGVESFLAALSAATLCLVLDVIARAERRFQLRHMLETADWFPEMTRRAAEATARISERYPETPVEAEARRLLREVTEKLEKMADGRLVRPQHDYEHLVSSMRNCHSTVDAVTNIVSRPSWWQDDLARGYRSANREAVNRGVRIRRLFIYDRLTPSLENLLRQQHEEGVVVATVHRRALTSAEHSNYAVFDRTRAWQAEMNAQAEIVGNVFIVDPAAVDALAAAFERCWSMAAVYGPRTA